jgi:CBS domain containing-hemolysin-like protein
MELVAALSDPTLWLGLLTLVALEIVLGIDNLVFIAILADKLPPEQRDRARIIGLSCALVMRLGLLATISWIVTLTAPLFSVLGRDFSGRDLIMFVGGLFLLFKATMELHERLEGHRSKHHTGPRVYASFGMVITQIVVLDAVFSIDSVITAVGMVESLPLMMVAVIIAVLVMMAASKPLTSFVNAHPTVVVLCLGFLMMIGLSLLAEGFGVHIPKGYLYAAIGFSVLVEAFNQFARSKRRRDQERRPLRERTAEAVYHLLGGKSGSGAELTDLVNPLDAAAAFRPSEQAMIRSVLNLAERPVKSIMTPRPDVEGIRIDETPEDLVEALVSTPYSLLVVYAEDSLEPLGIVQKKILLNQMLQGRACDLKAALQPVRAIPSNKPVLSLLEDFKRQVVHVAFVVDEFGGFEGLVTLNDVLEAIAGDIREESETENVVDIKRLKDGRYRVSGRADSEELAHELNLDLPEGDYHTAAGLVLHLLQHMPKPGDTISYENWLIRVVEMDGNRIHRLEFKPVDPYAAGV